MKYVVAVILYAFIFVAIFFLLKLIINSIKDIIKVIKERKSKKDNEHNEK